MNEVNTTNTTLYYIHVWCWHCGHHHHHGYTISLYFGPSLHVTDDDAIACMHTCVHDMACVRDMACVCDMACISDTACLCDTACVRDTTCVRDTEHVYICISPCKLSLLSKLNFALHCYKRGC